MAVSLHTWADIRRAAAKDEVGMAELARGEAPSGRRQMQTSAKTTKLIRDLNKKFGAGTWRTRVRDDERQIERKVNGQWQFWGWDDSFNADMIRQDYLGGPSAYHLVEVVGEYGY